MRFSVDPWDPSYGASLDTDLGESNAQVEADIEVPADRWAPVDAPAGLAPPAAVLFVDGVRRVDAQVWVDEPDGAASPALCASYAAGVVCCCREEGAHLLAAHVRRGLFTTAEGGTDVVTAAGSYRATRTAVRPDVAPAQVLSLALQRELGDTELAAAATARESHAGDDDLLVVDGPLRGRQHLPRAIGFVKTHRSDYLPPRLGAVVAALGPGQRTPVFRLGSSWERHTWYLRLPCRPGAPWAGIVRVECTADLPAAEAVALAALSQVTLVRYASTEYKDSRAPQNLYPIAGLERALRRRLGEPTLLYRALRRAAAA
ncbi:DNA double-strand break repair nuclease NurA [Pseudonocardia nigra]|uniref:DNA double-strand break repair nuclease NurA n=1 Tax=Pseudonocardia nigra TaxID=1921578 RepID=UPI001C600D8A|nr:DNA double-strand break repair nuclease NurA [Pseudonocardia nigra]